MTKSIILSYRSKNVANIFIRPALKNRCA